MTNPKDKLDPSHVFYVGQDVVCVRAAYEEGQRVAIASELVEGKVYRIRWLGIYSHYLDGDYLGIKVEGLERGICPEWGYVDQPFYANRFRPLVKDPLAAMRNIAANPDGYKPQTIEGPVRPRKLPVREKEREVVE